LKTDFVLTRGYNKILPPFFLWTAIFIISLSALFIIAFFAKKEGLSNLLLVSASQKNSTGINVNKIEEFTESDFLLTYELKSNERISLGYAEFNAAVITVNSSYPQITGKKLIEGSFFSRQAWTGKLKHAVLNETAAHLVFGGVNIAGKQIRMRNDIWLVTGVIDDGSDDSVIYIPSSISDAANASVTDFLALLSPYSGYDEIYAKNSLKSLGVHESNYNFYNLSSQLDLMYERAAIIIILFVAIILMFIFTFFIKNFKESFITLKIELSRHYANELLKHKRAAVIKPALITLLLICCPSLALFLLIRAASIILPWQDIPSIFDCRALFYPHIERLYNFEIASRLFFIFSLILLVTLVILLIRTKINNPIK